MGKTPRGQLSRAKRHAEIQDARRSLDEYLGQLPPLVRRYVVGQHRLSLEDWHVVYFSPGVREQCQDAFRAFERLAIRVPSVWRKHCALRGPGYKVITEYNLLKRIPRQGRPRRSRGETEDALTAAAVQEAMDRLADGVALRDRRKATGGSASDDQEIRRGLKDAGYEDDESLAIRRTRTLESAACRLVATRTGRQPSSVRTAVSHTRRAAKISVGEK